MTAPSGSGVTKISDTFAIRKIGVTHLIGWRRPCCGIIYSLRRLCRFSLCAGCRRADSVVGGQWCWRRSLGWGVDAHIRVIGGDAVVEFASLWEWLRSEPDLRGCVRVAPALPGEAEMGAVVDVLTVALGSGGAGAVLASSLNTWLRQRRSDVTITVSTPGRRTVQLEARQAADPLPLLREVLRDGDDH